MSRYALVQLRVVEGSQAQFRAGKSGGRLFIHDVAVGNARAGDDMDAATRRRFA